MWSYEWFYFLYRGKVETTDAVHINCPMCNLFKGFYFFIQGAIIFTEVYYRAISFPLPMLCYTIIYSSYSVVAHTKDMIYCCKDF